MKCQCLSHNGFLTVRGYEDAQRLSAEGLAPRGVHGYIDSMVSVSASGPGRDFPEWDDLLLEDQHRRFLND